MVCGLKKEEKLGKHIELVEFAVMALVNGNIASFNMGKILVHDFRHACTSPQIVHHLPHDSTAVATIHLLTDWTGSKKCCCWLRSSTICLFNAPFPCKSCLLLP